jgi:hypothetical protein
LVLHKPWPSQIPIACDVIAETDGHGNHIAYKAAGIKTKRLGPAGIRQRDIAGGGLSGAEVNEQIDPVIARDNPWRRISGLQSSNKRELSMLVEMKKSSIHKIRAICAAEAQYSLNK